ncbi:MAG: rhodanese-like domain-containing protein [Gammaproteobacteria bacterium]|nr:rhodanese-like domain-containing protein [Gammaproteobacteria bacterium]
MTRFTTIPALLLTCSLASAVEVRITPELEHVDVVHNGQPVRIMRNQDPQHTISERFAFTSRKCPPFCIQPAIIAPGVETIGELEMLQYLKQAAGGDASILIVDSRTPDWVQNGTIPGSVNIPWTTLDTGAGADPFEVADILRERFNVRNREGLWDFSAARTLVLFCNGNWCGQSPANIRTLLALGYPAARLKWYRGGMQNWEMLGLTVVK